MKESTNCVIANTKVACENVLKFCITPIYTVVRNVRGRCNFPPYNTRTLRNIIVPLHVSNVDFDLSPSPRAA